MNLPFIDTHAHLYFDQFDIDRGEVIEKCKTQNISKIINIGVDLLTSEQSVKLAVKHANMYATVGLHPTEGKDVPPELLYELTQKPKVVAIGECGLDFFRLGNNFVEPLINQRPTKSVNEVIEQQKQFFITQIKVAREVNLPLVIHSRQAFYEVVQILEEQNFPFDRVLFHSWSYSPTELIILIDKGAIIGVNAIVTYKNAKDVQQSVLNCPLEKIVLETDCPFLPPQSKRGERCDPTDLIETATKVAELKNSTIDEIAQTTTDNAQKFFDL